MSKIVKLGDVCNLQNGFAFKSKLFKEKGLPILRISNIQNERIDTRRPVYFNPSDYKIDFEKYKVKKGALLIAMSGATTGKIGFNKSQTTFYLNQRVGMLEPSKDLDKKYLYYILSTKIEENLKISKGAAQPNLNSEQIRNIVILLPPLTEQQHIVDKLDSVFTEIDNLIELNMNNENEIKSFYENSKIKIFENLLDFKEQTLKEVCEKITDGTHQTPKYFDKGYIFLSSRNVKTQKIDWGKIKYIDEKQHNEMQKRVSPRRGDILLAKNGTTGVGAIVDKDINFDIYVSLALLRSKGDILPEYMLEFINSKSAKEQFAERTKGIGVPNLHLQEIREVNIKYPKSKVEQNRVIKKINILNEQFNELLFISKKKHHNFLTLKSSIIKKELSNKTA